MTLHDHPSARRPPAPRPSRSAPPCPATPRPSGRIGYEAFRSFHESRGFAPDFPSVEAAVGLAAAQIADPATFGVVATRDGEIVGSNFLSEGDPIRGVGPITVIPITRASASAAC